MVANAGITDESNNYPIWELPIDLWDRTYATNVRGTFLTIKHFLQAAKLSQDESKKELDNLAIVVTGSECGKFGQAGHSEYASGKAGLMYGLIRSVKNEIVTLNGKARINAVAPGWVDTPLIEGRLDDPREMWAEAQATYVTSFPPSMPRSSGLFLGTTFFILDHDIANKGRSVIQSSSEEDRKAPRRSPCNGIPSVPSSSRSHIRRMYQR